MIDLLRGSNLSAGSLAAGFLGNLDNLGSLDNFAVVVDILLVGFVLVDNLLAVPQTIACIPHIGRCLVDLAGLRHCLRSIRNTLPGPSCILRRWV